MQASFHAKTNVQDIAKYFLSILCIRQEHWVNFRPNGMSFPYRMRYVVVYIG